MYDEKGRSEESEEDAGIDQLVLFSVLVPISVKYCPFLFENKN